MDAPKDDSFEYKMAKQFKKLKNKSKKILILDDILFVNMIDFWRKIKSPKIDATAFDHMSIDTFIEKLRECGFNRHGNEQLYSGITGEPLECCTLKKIYLLHMTV